MIPVVRDTAKNTFEPPQKEHCDIMNVGHVGFWESVRDEDYPVTSKHNSSSSGFEVLAFDALLVLVLLLLLLGLAFERF